MSKELKLSQYILDKMTEKSGDDRFFSGNCGMFAYALGKTIKEFDPEMDAILLFLHQSHPVEELTDLVNSDIDVFHVGLAFDGLKFGTSDNKKEIFDGEGIVTYKHVTDWIEKQYGQGTDYIGIQIGEIDDTSAFVIRNTTNYDTSWEVFYNEMQDIVKDYKRENKKTSKKEVNLHI